MARPVQQSTLVEVARAVLADDSAAVVRSRVTPLTGGAGNPSSAGVFRVSGVADTASGPSGWSAILKRLRHPEDEPGFSHPRNALYWRREVEVYGTDLLSDLPGGLVGPRCWLSEASGPDHADLWLEDLGPMDGQWSAAMRRSAVAHLARFHAAYLTGTPIPGYPWMAIYFARQWYELLMPVAERAVQALRGTSRHLFAPIAILDDPSGLLQVLEAAPQTLCHHDANPANLALRATSDGGEALAVIDWQLVGRGPVGEDLGQFLSSILSSAEAGDRDRLESEVLAAYHVELVSSGVRLTLPEVHRAYYCAAALRQVTFAFYLLGEQMRSAQSKDQSRASLENFVRQTRRGHLPALAARARALTDR